MDLNTLKRETVFSSRLYGTVALQAAAIEINGMTLAPDATKAYAEFTLGRPFPCIDAYQCCMHPGTVANSYQSMLHQVFDFNHQMRAYDQSKDRKDIPRDHILGSIVAVDFPRTPHGGWKMGVDKAAAPHIRGVAVIHKQAEKVKKVLGEHLSGTRKWAVSLEQEYSPLESGFIVGDRAKAKKSQQEFMSDTPKELEDLGFGYVTVESAPEELLACFNIEKRRVVGAWNGLPVTFLKGGMNGSTHFMGVGVVEYGAEREAEIVQIMASDPDRLLEMSDESLGIVTDYFKAATESMGELVKRLTSR